MADRALVGEGYSNYEALFLVAFDKVLGTLGESISQTILFYIQMEYHLPWMEIPSRLDRFHEALVGLFGTGAEVIEMKLAETICEYVGTRSKFGEDFDFAAEMQRAKRRFYELKK